MRGRGSPEHCFRSLGGRAVALPCVPAGPEHCRESLSLCICIWGIRFSAPNCYREMQGINPRENLSGQGLVYQGISYKTGNPPSL